MITTLDRLLSTPSVRAKIGFDIDHDKLVTSLPPDEAIKPLRRIVLDLAEKTVNVTKLKSKAQQIEYISGLASADGPNFSKKQGAARPVEGFSEQDFLGKSKAKVKRPRAASRMSRTTAIPRSCRLNITNAKIEEIYNELRTLHLSRHPHAIAVLLRVFIQASVDHYLTKTGGQLTFQTPNDLKTNPRKRKCRKASPAWSVAVQINVNLRPSVRLSAMTIIRSHRSFSMLTFTIDSFPLRSADLTAAWDNGQPMFERIWP